MGLKRILNNIQDNAYRTLAVGSVRYNINIERVGQVILAVRRTCHSCVLNIKNSVSEIFTIFI